MKLPLARGALLDPFLQEALRHHADVDKLLRRVWLPARQRLNPQDLLPEQRIWALVEAAARATRQRDFGWNAALDSNLSHAGPLGVELLSQPDLRSALELLQRSLSQFSSVSQPRMVEYEGSVWFRRGSIPGKGRGFWQVEQFAARDYISVVCHYAGPEWRPGVIKVQASAATARGTALARECGYLAGDHPSLEFAIEPGLLQPGATRPAFIPPFCDWQYDPMPTTYGEAFYRVLKNYIGDYPISIDMAVQVFELQPRTVMRRLAAEGLRLRDIRDELREERARKLLLETHLSIAEIARQLDYSHPGHFSRAFKRLTGLTPRQYRNNGN